MADRRDEEKKEKKKDKKKHSTHSPRELPVEVSSEKAPEIRINGLACKLQCVTVYNDQAELTYENLFDSQK